MAQKQRQNFSSRVETEKPIDMEVEQHHIQWEVEEEEEEEEEEVPLQGKQSRHRQNNVVAVINSNADVNGGGSGSSSGHSTWPSSATESQSPPNGENDELESAEVPTQEVSSNNNNDNNNNSNEEANDTAHLEAIGSKNSVYFDEQQGTQSTHELSGEKYHGVESSVIDSNLGDDESHAKANKLDIQDQSTEINVQFGANVERKSFLGLNLSPTENSCDESSSSFKHLDSKPRGDVAVDLIEEINQEIPELDVERIFQTQETHDLYCPNCNSCITKRVILRRRKPKIRKVRQKARTDTVDISSQPLLVPSREHPVDDQSIDSGNIFSNDSPTVAADDDRQDRESYLFRCLSCLCFFIPTDDSALEDPEADKTNKPRGNDHHIEPLADRNIRDSSEEIKPQQRGAESLNHSTVKKSPTEAYDKTQQSGPESLNHSTVEPEISPIEAYDKTQQIGAESLGPSTKKPDVFLTDAGHKSITEVRSEALPDQNGLSSTISNALLPAEFFRAPQPVNSAENIPVEAGKYIPKSSKQDHILIENPVKNEEEKSDNQMVQINTGDDVIVAVEEEPTSSQAVQNIVPSGEAGILPQTGTRTIVDERRRGKFGETYGLDILKSMVYGGLIESVTSLGVVSSAAGAGASTLNVLALGLANLFGGFLIIVHNLWELKPKQTGGASNELNEQEERYQELLGRREHFWVHATVAVLSYIVFGLVPPVVYGFSFRKSDDMEMKFIAVFVASLVCILLLGIGKAHIRKPPLKEYIKTALYYATMGLTASAASCFVGVLIKKLLAKLGWFETSLRTTPLFLEPNSLERAWVSY